MHPNTTYRSCFISTIAASLLLATGAMGQVQIDLGQHQTLYPNGYEGMSYFPDEPISILPIKPVSILSVDTKKTVLLQGNSIETAKKIRDVLLPAGKKGFDKDYAGITSIAVSPKTKRILAMYHAEGYVGGEVEYSPLKRTYQSVGLALADPKELKFRKVGQILSASVKRDDMKSTEDNQGLGDAMFLENATGDYFYAYFTDLTRKANSPAKYPQFPDSPPVVIGMARSRIDDDARPGSWKKYHDGRFDEEGLGGLEGIVVRPPLAFPSGVYGPHVTFVKSLNKYVMTCCVGAYADHEKQVAEQSGIYFTESDDGIHWADVKQLFVGHVGPYVGRVFVSHPRLLIEKEAGGEATGWLLYCYSDNWGTQPPQKPHYLCRRSVRLSLGKNVGGQAASKDEKAGLADRLKGSRWTNSNKSVFEWTTDGRLLHNNKERQWRVLDDSRVEITFDPMHKDIIQFDDALTRFTQKIRGGPDTFEGKRADASSATVSAPASSQPLAQRLKGTKWMRDGQPNNTFEWKQDGGLVQNGGNRKWKVLDDGSVEIRVPGKSGDRVDRWEFRGDMNTALQHGDGGKWKSEWIRVP